MVKEKQSRKKYCKISQKRRNSLIELVIQKGISMPKASRVLKMNISTAKNIIKIYRKQGRVMNKKMSKNQKNGFKNKQMLHEQVCKQQNDLLIQTKKETQVPKQNITNMNLGFIFPQYFYVPFFFLQNPIKATQNNTYFGYN